MAKRKPFIAVEFEAIDAVRTLAHGSGRTEAEIGWGLVLLWRWCWHQKTATVARTVAECHLPGMMDRLVAFGFVHDTGEETVTVRGLDRYITVALAQAEAARATNAKRAAAENEPEKPEPKPKKAKPTQPALLDVEPTPSPPKPPREPSRWEKLHAEWEGSREVACERCGIEYAPEKLAPGRINAFWSRLITEQAAKGVAEATVMCVADAFTLEDWPLKREDRAPWGLDSLGYGYEKTAAKFEAARATVEA